MSVGVVSRSYDNACPPPPGGLFLIFKQIYNEQIGDLLDPTQQNLEVSIYRPLWYKFHKNIIYYFPSCMLIVAWFKLLQMKDDSKSPLYIENVTEEYVTNYDEVTQILIKVGTKEASKQRLLKFRCLYAIYTLSAELI